MIKIFKQNFKRKLSNVKVVIKDLVVVLPGPVFVDEEHDGPGLGGVAESVDNFVKILLFGVPSNLGRHRNADASLLGQTDEASDALLAILALRGDLQSR